MATIYDDTFTNLSGWVSMTDDTVVTLPGQNGTYPAYPNITINGAPNVILKSGAGLHMVSAPGPVPLAGNGIDTSQTFSLTSGSVAVGFQIGAFSDPNLSLPAGTGDLNINGILGVSLIGANGVSIDAQLFDANFLSADTYFTGLGSDLTGSVSYPPDGVWSYGSSYQIVMQSVAGGTEIALENQAGTVLYDTTTDISLASLGNFKIALYQWNGGAPSYYADATVQDVKVTSSTPEPTTLTWIGGGNNKANNAADWSPTGTPKAGDTLLMTGGTMNVSGDQLKGDSLSMSGDSTVNLTNGAVATVDSSNGAYNGDEVINVNGVVALNVGLQPNSGDHVTVNLVGNAEWVGGFRGYSSAITINGSPHAMFINNGIDSFSKTGVVINVAIAGNGTLDDLAYGSVQLNNSVGAGQTVDLGVSANLTLNDPKQFLGTVAFALGGVSAESIDLNGLAKADSYTYTNDMLTIYSAKKVIDTLRIDNTTPGSGTLYVDRTSLGVVVSNYHPVSGVPLPVHT